jgi:hypothetical protein
VARIFSKWQRPVKGAEMLESSRTPAEAKWPLRCSVRIP